MKYLLCKEIVSGKVVRFPYAVYNYNPPTNGTDNSVYSKVSIVEYQSILNVIYNALDISSLPVGDNITLSVLNSEGETTDAFIRINKTDVGHCNFSVGGLSDNPLQFTGGVIAFDVNYDEPELNLYETERRTNGYRLCDTIGGSVVNTIYYWIVDGVGNFSNVLFIDPIQGKLIVRVIGASTYVLGAYRTTPYYVSVDYINRDFNTNPLLNTDPDPNITGGVSDVGGGDGSFNGVSDDYIDARVPWVSVTDTGFVKLYNPSLSELQNLATYMWTTDFIENIKKLFADPMDAILSLALLPVPVPDGGADVVTVGNVSTGIIMNRAGGNGKVHIDCGSLSVEKYWGNAMDYSPYTRFSIYLPFIGARPLNVDEVMGKTITVSYDVDILTGACVCEVFSRTTDGKLYIAYQYEGNCAKFLPVTGTNWAQIVKSIISTASTFASAGTTGGAVASTIMNGLTNTANNVMNMKPQIERSGQVTGAGSHLAYALPYIVMEYPRQCLPSEYNKFEGYPSSITAVLGDLRGYTRVETIHLEGINATDREKDEIESLLKSGVIL